MIAVLSSAMRGAPPPEVVKVCACGRRYTAEAWRDLRLVGIWEVAPDRLELRDCVCCSTIAIVLPRVEVATC